MKKYLIVIILALSAADGAEAQDRALVNTSKSSCALLGGTDIDAVHWTGGFWGERFESISDTMVLNMWHTLSETTGAYDNFLVASGRKQGRHRGPQFFDGDFYKWFEGLASVYAITHNPLYDKMMDDIIVSIAGSQRADGYIHTPVIIKERYDAAGDKDGGEGPIGTATGDATDGAFGNRLNFETYNLGHLMTAACVHWRATGKHSLLDVAIKAANFLCDYCDRSAEELAGNAICPSHYMGIVEMYRATGNTRYLKLAEKLIEIRSLVKGGTDDNQDRIPFSEQKVAMGHAVRANYLYAGVADVVAETGNAEWMANLESIWTDITTRKMYITGACGALYDGTSPDGTSYEPDYIQKVHQSYGRAYQLPNSTAHNETCANIGNLLFNWRMFLITGESKYMDVVETVIYNSLLCGVSLDEKRYFYTNPLRVSEDFPYTLRWPKERTENISCFCCPPNTMRTICEIQDYAYSVAEDGIRVNLYGCNELDTSLPDGSKIRLSQQSDYPWDGEVLIKVEETTSAIPYSLSLHIPSWANGATVEVKGTKQAAEAGSYIQLKRVWKRGDIVKLSLPMKPILMEAHPLVEEARGQVAVQRGPIVYCLESQDISDKDCRIDDILIPLDAKFGEKMIAIDGSRMLSLETQAMRCSDRSRESYLYRPATKADEKTGIILIPYYAWGNRGQSEMSVWIGQTN